MQDPARPWHVHLEQAGLPWSHASLDFLQGSHAAFLKDILQASILSGFAKFVVVHRVGEELAEREIGRQDPVRRDNIGWITDRSRIGVNSEWASGRMERSKRFSDVYGTVTRSTHYPFNWAVLYTVYSTHVVWSQT